MNDFDPSFGPATFEHRYTDRAGLIFAGAAFAMILLWCATMFALGWIIGYLR